MPGAADKFCTAYAAVAGVSAVDDVEAGPVPAELIAEMVTAYAVPFVKPVIVHGDDVHDVDVTNVPDGLGVATIW